MELEVSPMFCKRPTDLPCCARTRLLFSQRNIDGFGHWLWELINLEGL